MRPLPLPLLHGGRSVHKHTQPALSTRFEHTSIPLWRRRHAAPSAKRANMVLNTYASDSCNGAWLFYVWINRRPTCEWKEAGPVPRTATERKSIQMVHVSFPYVCRRLIRQSHIIQHLQLRNTMMPTKHATTNIAQAPWPYTSHSIHSYFPSTVTRMTAPRMAQYICPPNPPFPGVPSPPQKKKEASQQRS